MYCKKCGGKIESYASHCPFCGEAVVSNGVQATYTVSNGEIKVKSKNAFTWLMANLVSIIPALGLLVLLVWAFSKGTKDNPNFRSWARAQIVVVLLLYALAMVITAFHLGWLKF